MRHKRPLRRKAEKTPLRLARRSTNGNCTSVCAGVVVLTSTRYDCADPRCVGLFARVVSSAAAVPDRDFCLAGSGIRLRCFLRVDRRRFPSWRARRRTAHSAHGAAPSFDDRGATIALARSARTAVAARFAATFQPESARAIPAVERGSAARTHNDATGVFWLAATTTLLGWH